MHSKIIKVDGMGCEACEKRIEAGLSAMPEVEAAKADAVSGEVSVSYDCCFNPAEAMKIISDLGYKPFGIK